MIAAPEQLISICSHLMDKPSVQELNFYFHYIYLFCGCAWAHSVTNRVSPLRRVCGPRGSNSGHQAWEQLPYPLSRLPDLKML